MEILYEKKAQEKVYGGINKIANLVKLTLGPAGKNILVENEWGIFLTNDGYTITKNIKLEDKIEDYGRDLINQVAERTNKYSKGGRTTAVTLAQELIKRGRKEVKSRLFGLIKGRNAVKIRVGMQQASLEVKRELDNFSIPLKTEQQLAQVATISSESEEIGDMVAKILKEVGPDGVVTVEGTNQSETSYEIVNGMEFDKGFISPHFITNPERQEAILDQATVLITDRKLSNGKEMLDFLGKVKHSGRDSIFIVAEDVTDQALASLVVNKIQGIMNIVAVKAPEHSNYTKQMLEDLAILTGTEVFSEASGLKLDAIDPEKLGIIEKVTVSSDKTTLVGGQDTTERVQSLKFLLEKETDEYEKNRLKKRIAKLSAGVCVINVGGATESDLIYKKQKTEDAVNDAKSAMEEGVVAGGGVALSQVKLMSHFEDKDVQKGYDIVKDSLSIQLKQIVKNTGQANPNYVLQNIGRGGYDAKNNVFVKDMFEAGIIDSLKVTKMVLENAVSLASIALTLGGAYNKQEKKV